VVIAESIAVPLRLDSAGRLMVVGTRIPLEAIVLAFQRGSSPESIQAEYDSVSLSDVSAVLTYYLKLVSEIDHYISERQRECQALRYEYEKQHPVSNLKAALLASA